MIKLLLVAEIADAGTEAEAQALLDAFRETVLPSREYGITFYRATPAELTLFVGGSAPGYVGVVLSAKEADDGG